MSHWHLYILSKDLWKDSLKGVVTFSTIFDYIFDPPIVESFSTSLKSMWNWSESALMPVSRPSAWHKNRQDNGESVVFQTFTKPLIWWFFKNSTPPKTWKEFVQRKSFQQITSGSKEQQSIDHNLATRKAVSWTFAESLHGHPTLESATLVG